MAAASNVVVRPEDPHVKPGVKQGLDTEGLLVRAAQEHGLKRSCVWNRLSLYRDGLRHMQSTWCLCGCIELL